MTKFFPPSLPSAGWPEEGGGGGEHRPGLECTFSLRLLQKYTLLEDAYISQTSSSSGTFNHHRPARAAACPVLPPSGTNTPWDVHVSPTSSSSPVVAFNARLQPTRHVGEHASNKPTSKTLRRSTRRVTHLSIPPNLNLPSTYLAWVGTYLGR
ncbi:hypothetical protein LZ32DRAFT_255262 [Colletotrichum eremochloae]|nr:hypothetical protein LZ32DRAFT_255262 [Colletotrichum eremochloae]